MGLEQVRLLKDRAVADGERWIYVADFNIKHKGTELKSTDRIDAEIEDLKQLVSGGARVAILAHQGRFKDNDTGDLDFVVPYLSRKLGVDVRYHPDNADDPAAEFSLSLKHGEVAVMGNVRKNKGEERNDLELAARFAKLGDFVAVGGFGKAHRSECSNSAILELLPGFMARSQADEMDVLMPWAGADGKYSVAVLGGVKKEKITTGLLGFLDTYRCIIPGGIVLNTLLKVKGYEIGDSVIADSGKTFEKEVLQAIHHPEGYKIHTPEEVFIAEFRDGKFNKGEYDKPIRIEDGVPKGYMIVDYVMPYDAIRCLDKLVDDRGRMVMAGTPGVYTAGFRSATDTAMEYMKNHLVRGIVLGGDTAAEVSFSGAKSTGGGSALHFVAYGTTPAFEALKKNKTRFQ